MQNQIASQGFISRQKTLKAITELMKTNINNNEIWIVRLKQLKQLARRYGQEADDIFQEVYLIFISRNKFPSPTLSYFRILFLEAARNLRIDSNFSSFEQLRESGHDIACSNQEWIEQEQRMRIHEAVRESPPQIQDAVNLVLGGANMGAAAKAVALSQSQFTEILHRAGTLKK